MWACLKRLRTGWAGRPVGRGSSWRVFARLRSCPRGRATHGGGRLWWHRLRHEVVRHGGCTGRRLTPHRPLRWLRSRARQNRHEHHRQAAAAADSSQSSPSPFACAQLPGPSATSGEIGVGAGKAANGTPMVALFSAVCLRAQGNRMNPIQDPGLEHERCRKWRRSDAGP